VRLPELTEYLPATRTVRIAANLQVHLLSQCLIQPRLRLPWEFRFLPLRALEALVSAQTGLARQQAWLVERMPP
jgi:hypothetical protein